MLVLQVNGDLRQRHIWRLLDQRQNLLSVRLDPLRAIVAALRSGMLKLAGREGEDVSGRPRSDKRTAASARRAAQRG